MVGSMVAFFSTLEWILQRRWRLLGGLALGVLAWAGLARAGVTTIPPSSRTTNICVALGADEGCVWSEVAHLKGDVTLVAYDPVSPGGALNPVLVVAQIKGREVSMPLGPASEQSLRNTVDDPGTDYVNLMVGSAAWPALRELAHVGDGVAIVLDARKSLTPRPTRATSDAAATTRTLKVRIALVQLQ
jgi:hypothetical protein